MTSASSVRRRHVFYVSGFDPNGPPRFHKLYTDGARQQALVTGVSIAVGARSRIDADTMAWTVFYQRTSARDAQATDPAVETNYVFPRWDYVIRDYWWQDTWPQLRDVMRTSWQYVGTGAMWKIFRQARGPFIALFAPFFLMLALLPGLALGLWAWIWLALALERGGVSVWPIAFAMAALAMGLAWARYARRYWRTMWVLRSHAFAGRMGGEGVPAMEKRIDAMAAALCRQVADGADDEVLVVGHSLGSIVAVSALARAYRLDPRLEQHGTAISLMTLGHCTPLVSNLPAARRFRDELALLAQAPGLCWVDFSDPLDDYGFAGVDPVAAAGIESSRPGHPQVISPHFAGLYGPGPHQKAPMSLHELHQQYLCAGTQADAYDYFALTAGPLTLAQRFPSSPAAR